MQPKFRLTVALTAVALAACVDSQAPEESRLPPSTTRSLPLLSSARTDERGEKEEHERRGRPGKFNITLRFLDGTGRPGTSPFASTFVTARRRWEDNIVKDVPRVKGGIPADFCELEAFLGVRVPAINQTIDDLFIDVLLFPIDGPFNILGFAGPCAIREKDGLSAYGVMVFDTEDIALVESLGLFDEVIIHEMGHVLGFGTLWELPPIRDLLRNGGTPNPLFTGRHAVQAYRRLGGRGLVPVEGDFGPGTADGHWDEDTFDNELMTGFLNLGNNPLSNMSIRSMQDLGYGVEPNGDRYRLPSPAAMTARRGILEGLRIADHERLIRPKGAIP